MPWNVEKTIHNFVSLFIKETYWKRKATFFLLPFIYVLCDIYFQTLNTYQHYEQSGIWGVNWDRFTVHTKALFQEYAKKSKFGRKCVHTQKKNLIDDRFTC